MTEEYAGPCDLVHGGDECAAVNEGYWGDDEEEIAFVKRWNCDPKTLGAYGEDLACELLKRNDYIILERNWSCAAGEADIIALDDGCLVFVEVKTRAAIKAFLRKRLRRRSALATNALPIASCLPTMGSMLACVST